MALIGLHGYDDFGDSTVSVPASANMPAAICNVKSESTDVTCGCARGVQKMLNDLGIGVETPNGVFTQSTFGVIDQFNKAHGLKRTNLSSPGFCKALSAAWEAKQSPPSRQRMTSSDPVPPPPVGRPTPPPCTNCNQGMPPRPGSGIAPSQEPKGGLAGWWAARTDTEKMGVGAAAVVAVGVLAFLLGKKRRDYKPNQKACRLSPPKKYRKIGATKRSDYALPDCFMYPITDPTHVRAAASRFGKYKDRYSKATQRKIQKRIDAAERKFGIGKYRT